MLIILGRKPRSHNVNGFVHAKLDLHLVKAAKKKKEKQKRKKKKKIEKELKQVEQKKGKMKQSTH